MKIKSLGMTRVLRLSGVLLILGLAIEAVSLLFNHPLSFMGFMIVGGTLMAIGVLLFLISLVEAGESNSDSASN
jgi:hypothetical protein